MSTPSKDKSNLRELKVTIRVADNTEEKTLVAKIWIPDDLHNTSVDEMVTNILQEFEKYTPYIEIIDTEFM